MTYQYVVCLSSKPRSSPYPERNPLPELLEEDVPDVDEHAEGEAVIEVRNPNASLNTDADLNIDIHRRVQPRWNSISRPHRRPAKE